MARLFFVSTETTWKHYHNTAPCDFVALECGRCFCGNANTGATLRECIGLELKLTLHIGMAKAGSTSIQDSLYAARENIQKYGCMYPEPIYIRSRHHWLQPLVYTDLNPDSSVVARMGFTAESAKEKALEEWENLLKQLKAKKPEYLVLSSEVLFKTCSKQEIARARQ